MSFWETLPQHHMGITEPSHWLVTLAHRILAAAWPVALTIALILGCCVVAVWRGR